MLGYGAKIDDRHIDAAIRAHLTERKRQGEFMREVEAIMADPDEMAKQRASMRAAMRAFLRSWL